MDTFDFKNILGELQPGKPATIRFFGKITQDSAAQFNSQFDYVESFQPSVIRVLINCEGGSVLHGMSCYATIQDSSVPTECINAGMAASMGSILLAAGDKSLMWDYSILMIHNPFMPSAPGEEPNDMVLAFTKQIRTIYRKRFNLDEKHIEAIMNGDAGKDGTFFDAKAAVDAGIIREEFILTTSPQLCERVRNELNGLEDITQIQTMMSRISAEAVALQGENKPSGDVTANLSQTNKKKENPMSEVTKTSVEYSAVATTLGMKDNFEPKDVMARISELISAEASLKEKDKQLNDLNTVVAGKDATITNLQTNVSELTASLKVYQDKEEEEKLARVENMLVKAANKIPKEDIPKWRKLAIENPDLVESTLDSIPEVEKISKEIATDPANVQAAADATKTTEEKLSEKVSQVVGEGFEFKKI